MYVRKLIVKTHLSLVVLVLMMVGVGGDKDCNGLVVFAIVKITVYIDSNRNSDNDSAGCNSDSGSYSSIGSCSGTDSGSVNTNFHLLVLVVRYNHARPNVIGHQVQMVKNKTCPNIFGQVGKCSEK